MRVCKHCNIATRSSDDVARAKGWRWYSGPTQGGGHLDDVVCPACSGRGEPALLQWQVGCRTCGWEHEAWDEDERITDGKSALSVLDYHECEPELWIRPPGADMDYRPSAFDRDGNLRPQPLKASVLP